MKKRGVSRCAALLVVLLMMMSAFAMLPSQDATAQTHKIWGYVKKMSCAGPVSGATVGLTDVHGLDPTFQTGLDGYYEFMTGPGFYEVKVTKDGYFSQERGPFRFNGTKNMKLNDFCLEEAPTRDYEFTGAVLSSVTESISKELVDFDILSMPEENVTGTFNSSANTVDLSNPPVAYGSYDAWWNNATSLEKQLTDTVDYTLDLWTGVATILNGVIASELNSGTGWLNFTYDHADNTSALQNGYISSYTAFKNGGIWGQQNYDLDVDTGDLEIITGDFVFGSDTLEFDYDYHPTIIADAAIKIFNVTKDHTVDEDTSLTDGTFMLSTWAGAFELQASAEGYQPYSSNIQVTGDTHMWILMDPAITINGWVTDDTGSSPVQNVRAFMFCQDAVPESMKILEADVSGSYYEFDAFPGNFRLYVDADGYQAKYKDILVSADQVHDFELTLSEEELVDTSIGYVGNDWNMIAVYKNLTLNTDSHIPSLGTPNFGSLALEIDWAVGDKSGTVTVPEWAAFEVWLEERGPQYLMTGGFFTTEQVEYTLEPTGYSVTVTNDNQHVWIQTVAQYSATGIETGQLNYDLNLRTNYDESVLIEGEDRVLRNYTYWVHAPYSYELIWNSSANTDIIGATDILVDPLKGTGIGSVVLTLGVSETGQAIAEVIGPMEGESELYVYLPPDNTLDDYRAVVPAEWDIQFSAAKSTDVNGPQGMISPYANFTWKFGDGETGWGIEPTHNYSDPGTGSADYTVNLTIREPGGNLTWKDISVQVDARTPHALVWFDINDYEVKNGQMHIEEDIKFTFGANLSTDLMWDGKDGNITLYEWDFDSDGIVDEISEDVETEFYIQPGEYILNLTIWDWVGHKSENYSKTIYVGDVTPPDAIFKTIDARFVENEYPYEQEVVYFNASDSTDNFSDFENLTIKWTIDNSSETGDNVTHTFPEPGSYPVNLTVTDEAGNEGYFNRTVDIRGNRSLHSHISIPSGTLKFSPESPEVGQTVKIKVNVSNSDEGLDATGVSVRFWIKGETTDKEITGTVRFYDENGTEVSAFIPKGTHITAEISWKPGSQGEYDILVNCTADNEFPNSLDDNDIQAKLKVKEAGWVTPLIIVILFVLIFIIAIILLLRRKFGGRFPKLRKEKKPEKEKEKKKKKRVKK